MDIQDSAKPEEARVANHSSIYSINGPLDAKSDDNSSEEFMKSTSMNLAINET